MEMAQGQSLRAAKPDTPPIDANLLLLTSARESNLAVGEAALRHVATGTIFICGLGAAETIRNVYSP